MHWLILAGASIWSRNLSWKSDRSHMGNTICAEARASIVCTQVDSLKIKMGGKTRPLGKKKKWSPFPQEAKNVGCAPLRCSGGGDDFVYEDCTGGGGVSPFFHVEPALTGELDTDQNIQGPLFGRLSADTDKTPLRQTYFTSDQAREERRLVWLSFD